MTSKGCYAIKHNQPYTWHTIYYEEELLKDENNFNW